MPTFRSWRTIDGHVVDPFGGIRGQTHEKVVISLPRRRRSYQRPQCNMLRILHCGRGESLLLSMLWPRTPLPSEQLLLTSTVMSNEWSAVTTTVGNRRRKRSHSSSSCDKSFRSRFHNKYIEIRNTFRHVCAKSHVERNPATLATLQGRIPKKDGFLLVTNKDNQRLAASCGEANPPP
jgi:hypothetical protein